MFTKTKYNETVVSEDFNDQKFHNAYSSAQIEVLGLVKKLSSEIDLISRYIDELCLGNDLQCRLHCMIASYKNIITIGLSNLDSIFL